MRIRILSFLAIQLLLISGCEKKEVSDISPLGISNQARAYLNEVLTIMENNSINRLTINWTEFKNSVFATVPNAQTISETYPGISEALKLLGDNHSTFTTHDGISFKAPSLITVQHPFENLELPTIPDDIGYVRVTSYSGSSVNETAINYILQLQNSIREQDQTDRNGWIVDLRNNTGGNMWPMVTGIGPLLGEGILGYFIEPNGSESYWAYQHGASVSNGNTVSSINNSYILKNSNPRIAVLLNSFVASSGEAIAISFIGRENTKSFGVSTWGVSTSNRAFRLSGGSTLNLTTAYMADRNKNKFGSSIIPDVLTNANGEIIINEAINWIRN